MAGGLGYYIPGNSYVYMLYDPGEKSYLIAVFKNPGLRPFYYSRVNIVFKYIDYIGNTGEPVR